VSTLNYTQTILFFKYNYLYLVAFFFAFLNREQPGSEEFKELSSQKVPLLLNLAMALIKSEIYYEALRHCSSALEIEPGKEILNLQYKEWEWE